MLKFSVAVKTALATAGLLAIGATAAQAAPVGTHGNPLAACQKWAKANTFVWITKATGTARAGLTVTGQTVRVHCGGPDDSRTGSPPTTTAASTR